jgi:hypothetical protein
MRFRFVVAIMALAGASAIVRAQEPAALPLDKALKKARAGGKYSMLLRQIWLPDDRKGFTDFFEFGYRTDSTCAQYTNLPKGYWVYVAPYWYIWRDRAGSQETGRAWGPEQATGKPDTPHAGDMQSAWASATPDGSDEWLLLEYAEPVWAKAVNIYETYNPGAVVRITAFTLDDREIEIWSRPRPDIFSKPAKQPTEFFGFTRPSLDLSLSGLTGEVQLESFRRAYGGGQTSEEFGRIFKPAFTRRVLTNRIKIYLASSKVPAWNEIDAVGLRGEDGTMQWATAAHASSIYGVGQSDESRPAPPTDPRDERIRQLEEENRRLREELGRVKGNRPIDR